MNNWTKQEDKVLQEGYGVGRPISEIAEELGRTEGAVRGRASLLGISIRITKEQQEQIKKI